MITNQGQLTLFTKFEYFENTKFPFYFCTYFELRIQQYVLPTQC